MYPPYSLPDVAFDRDAISSTCLNCDDLWLKFMTTANGYPSVTVSDTCSFELIPGTQDVGLYNQNADMSGNDEAIASIIDYLDDSFSIKQPLMKRLRCIGNEGEWIGPDAIDKSSLF